MVSRLAFCLVGLCVVPRFGVREWALTGLAIVLAYGVWHTDTAVVDLNSAMDRAAFFGSFIYLISLLKEAAVRSPSIQELGYYLTNQPPGRRYYATAVGGHLLGVLMNFSAVTLLAPLIQRGARADPIVTEQDERRAQIRERRQMSALLRGFPWMLIWAPTSLTQAVLLSSLPGIETATVVSLGIGCTVIMIVLGRMEEWFHWRHIIPSKPLSVLPFPKVASRNLFFICVLLIGSTYVVAYVVNVSTAVALMLMAPLVMCGWIASQNVVRPLSHTASKALSILSGIFRNSAIGLSQTSYVLGLAGFIGDTAADMAPVDLIVGHLNLEQVPAWLFLISLPVIITLCGQIALTPLLVVVFLSSIFVELPVLPADPSHIVFAMGVGWALSMTASPNATATLMISGICKIPPTTLTWRWNGIYSLLCFTVFCGIFYAITIF